MPSHALPSSVVVRRKPDGSVLTMSDLPPIGTCRWTIARKEVVVLALATNMVSMNELCARYNDLSIGELLEWMHRYEKSGAGGLRADNVREPA